MEIISESIASSIIDAIIHAGIETIKVLPFMFVAFVMMELMEHRDVQIKHTGYLIGALAGCIPQCGFAVAGANLWAGRRISLGTLVTVFISTSDEALLLLMGSTGHLKDAGYILLIKVIVAVVAGYTVDHVKIKTGINIEHRKITSEKYHSCCCGTSNAIIRTAGVHTVKLLLIVFVFSVFINVIINGTGKEVLSSILLTDNVLQPVIASAVGLIPSCVPSVLITQLYIEGLLSFPSLLAGLIANAGIGLIVVKSVQIAAILFITAVISAFMIQFLPLS